MDYYLIMGKKIQKVLYDVIGDTYT